MLRVGEIFFFREEHTKWLPNATWSALQAHIQATLYKLSKFYLGKYICIWQQLVKKGDLAFEREQKRIYGIAWREKRKSIKMIIITSNFKC